MNLWTEKDVATLRMMAGVEDPETIAQTIKRTRGAVVFKAYKLRLSMRTASRAWTQKDIDKMRSLREETDLTWEGIGYSINRSAMAVRKKWAWCEAQNNNAEIKGLQEELKAYLQQKKGERLTPQLQRRIIDFVSQKSSSLPENTNASIHF